eukprot:6207121-Pleurochrysis_carterae.AAC.3
MSFQQPLKITSSGEGLARPGDNNCSQPLRCRKLFSNMAHALSHRLCHCIEGSWRIQSHHCNCALPFKLHNPRI